MPPPMPGQMPPIPGMPYMPGTFPPGIGFQFPPNDLFGSTKYKYTTPDGKPPLDGKIPTAAPAFGTPPAPFMPGGSLAYGVAQSSIDI